MTSEDLKSELFKDPFTPLRLHLVSGKTVDVFNPAKAWVLQNALLVFQNANSAYNEATGYDVIAFRNIERIEQVLGGEKSAR